MAIAGTVGEPAVEDWAAAPAGAVGVAPAVRPWLAGSTYAVALIVPSLPIASATFGGTWIGLKLRPLFGLVNPVPTDSIC